MELANFKPEFFPKEPVSVIIPTYNRCSFLRKAIESLLTQTYRNFELIVVDDGSTDSTARLVASCKEDITYISQKNRGPAAARNAGVSTSRHDLIAFLDDDDRFDSRKLEVQVAAMELHPNFLISHTQEIWFRKGKVLNQKKKHRKSGGDIFAQSLALCAVSMSTVMIRKELFNLVGMFDEELICCEDYDFWLRVSISHPFLLIDHPLTLKDGGRADQVSFLHRIGMDRYRIRVMQKLLASDRLSGRQRCMALAELARKCTIYGTGCLKHGRAEEGKNYLDLARRYGA